MSGNNIEFTSNWKKEFIKLKKKLKDELTKQRYEHTLGVAYTASAMAMAHGTDIKKALFAGVLHDCAKCIDDEIKIAKCEKYGLTVTDYEKTHSYLLHAKLGALLAKKNYNIEDEEILSSIKYHTTGKPDMTALEKIIYIADYIEPCRKEIPGLNDIRKTAYADLDLCMYQILQSTILYLKKSLGDDIEENTKEAFRYYKDLIERRSSNGEHI